MGAVQYFGNGTDAVARAARRLARSRRAPRGVRRKPYPRVRIFPRGTPRRGEILAFVPRADLPPSSPLHPAAAKVYVASEAVIGLSLGLVGGAVWKVRATRPRDSRAGPGRAGPRVERTGGYLLYFSRPRPRPRAARETRPRPRRPPPAPASLTPRPVPASLAELALVEAQEHREVLRRERRQVIRAARGSRGVPPRSWSGGDVRTMRASSSRGRGSVEGVTRTSHRLRNAFGILQHHPPFPEFSSPTSPPPAPHRLPFVRL